MQFEEIVDLIKAKIGEAAIAGLDTFATPKAIIVSAGHIVQVCQELFENEHTYFDSLSCLTGVDNGPEAGTMEVVYNLYSIPFDHHLMIKVPVTREQPGQPIPEVPTVKPHMENRRMARKRSL